MRWRGGEGKQACSSERVGPLGSAEKCHVERGCGSNVLANLGKTSATSKCCGQLHYTAVCEQDTTCTYPLAPAVQGLYSPGKCLEKSVASVPKFTQPEMAVTPWGTIAKMYVFCKACTAAQRVVGQAFEGCWHQPG